MPLCWDIHCVLVREISGSMTTNHFAITSAAGARELCELEIEEIAALFVAERIPSPRMGRAIIMIALDSIVYASDRHARDVLRFDERNRLDRNTEGGGKIIRGLDAIEHADMVPNRRTLITPGIFGVVLYL